MRKVNEFFSYALFAIGVLKIVFVVLVLIQLGNNIAAIFNGGSTEYGYYPIFSMIIGFAQIMLAIGSVVMIILNINKQPGVIPGYLWGLGAVLLELIAPSFVIFFAVLAECGMYMKAGTKIRNSNGNTSYDNKNRSHKKIKQDIKNTEWFYGEEEK